MITRETRAFDDSVDQSKWDVVILGGGTAALLAATAMAKHLPHLNLLVVRSTKLGVIGVGEGTIATIGRFLHEYLSIDTLRFHREVRPSIKLGIQFKWGSKTPYHYSFAPQFSAANPLQQNFSRSIGEFCGSDARFANLSSSLMFHGKVASLNANGSPVLSPRFAYHLENRAFVGFLERYTDELGVKKIDAIVDRVAVNQKGVESLMLDTGQQVRAKLFVDCSGFRSELLGKALKEDFVSFGDSLWCDRAVVGGWKREEEPYYAFTTAEAMNSGWSWRIEHDELVNRGYVYSSSFMSDEAAETEFCVKNPKITDTRVIQFRSGAYQQSWVQNVVAIGNAAGFVEPLEATAIGFMTSAIDQVIAILKSGSEITDIHRSIFNRSQAANWTQTRDFLALHYKPNQESQSAFWKACRNDIPLGEAQDILDFYQATGPEFRALQSRLRSDIFGAEGYLSVLVGQRVPYPRIENTVSVEQTKWMNYQQRLRRLGSGGMEMSNYLEMVRGGYIDPPI